jgi:hypothetical protein
MGVMYPVTVKFAMTLGPNASPTVAPSVVKMPLRVASDGGVSVCI